MLHTNTEKFYEGIRKLERVDIINEMKEMDVPKEIIDILIKRHNLEEYF